MIDIPTLVTERLLLRPQTMEDWPDYAAMMASNHARFMGGPHTAEQAWGMFCHDLAQWEFFGHGALMIDERSSRRCIGQVGINAGPLFPERELGWLVYEGFEGQGFATEAARAFRDWAFDEHRLEALVSYIHPDNAKSRRLAERLGASVDPASRAPAPEDLVYRYPRD